MSTERQVPGGQYVNQTATAQRQVPGGPYLNDTTSTTAFIAAPPVVVIRQAVNRSNTY